MRYFDIADELFEFRDEVIKKHPNLLEEVKALIEERDTLDAFYFEHKILALKEIIIKIRLDPEEANSKYLIKMIDDANAKKQSSPQDMCKCGHERQWHDFDNMEECRVDAVEDTKIDCYCLKFANAKTSESQGGKK